jgi:cytochrome P450
MLRPSLTWGARCTVRPERWESVPEAVLALPSVYGHLVTFIAGAHACIGYRFSVVECVIPHA